MATVVRKASVIKAAGNNEKIIREFFGNVNTGTSELSLALMKSPQGWEEPGQSPEFEEYTLVLKGKLVVKTLEEEIILSEGEAIVTKKGEWVKYNTPYQGGAEYIAVCLPAFSPSTVHRDDQAY
jgi:quercetin dioxygenase-like cupin family protein